MRLLLDTHALIWWSLDDPLLSRTAHAAILDDGNEVFVSAVSAFEMALKHRLGKLDEVEPLLQGLDQALRDDGFQSLPLTIQHGRVAGALPIPHKDPFDRMLIAQAQVEGAWLVSNEALFDGFGVHRLW